jgi:SAM-dependent methyltransferase
MNCFQLIKTVLDEAYAEIPGTEDEKDAAIQKQMDALSIQYSKLCEKGCLDYSDPARRFAYLFTYTTSHANIVHARIRASNPLSDIFDRKDVTVGCVGGGPGSDFLGVLKYCEQAKKSPNLTCHLLDRDPAWGESWSDVGKKVGGSLQLTTHFNPFDVTDPKKWRIFKKHLQADFFTLIYFMSEVYALRENANPYFNTLLAEMKPGALLLFVDNNSPEFRGWFDEIANKHNVKILESEGGVMQLPTHEEKRDLEPYRTRLKRDPKLSSNVAWRVLQKKAQQ